MPMRRKRWPGSQIDQRLERVRESEIEQVLADYLGALAAECARGAFVPQPGVAALIPRLAGEARVLLGLCTGNLERGAELKLRSTQLWHAFRFGGYGSDAEPRAEIVRCAWTRARAHGATEALVIDDTPRGVQAARDAGLPACGVATGRFSAAELREAGARFAVDSFADLDASLSLLLGPL